MEKPYIETQHLNSDLFCRILVWDKNLVDMWELGNTAQRIPFKGVGERWHAHDEFEITFVTSGHGVLAVGDYLGTFEAPECFVLGQNLPHYWKSRGLSSGVSFQFNSTQLKKLLAFKEWEDLNEVLKKSKYGLRYKPPLFISKQQLMDLENLNYRSRLIQIFGILNSLIFHFNLQSDTLSESLILAEPSPQNQKIQAVLIYLLEHFKEPIKLEDLVLQSGMSQATFIRHFKKLTGKNFVHYLNHLRLHEVRRLLLESDKSILEIALSTGFNNLSHFNSIFKKEFNCSPKLFRETQAI